MSVSAQTEVVSKAAKACLEAISGESPDRRRDRRRRGLAANQAACTEAKRVRIGASLMQRAKEREMAQLKERLGRLMETYETKFGQYVAIMTELTVHSQRDCYADKRLEIYEEMALEDEPLLMDALADAISFTNLARNAYLLSAFKKIAALYGKMRPHAETIRSIREGKVLTALRTQTGIDENAIANDETLEGEDTEVGSAATSMLTSAVGGSQIGVDEQEDPSTPVGDDPIVTPSNRSDSDEPYTPRENLHITTSSGGDSEEPNTSIGDHNSTTPSIKNGVGEEPVSSQDRPITTSSSLSGVDEPSTSPREHSITTQLSGSDIEEPSSSHGDRIVITQSSRGGIEDPLTSGEDGLITTTPSNQSGVDEPSFALGQDYPHGVDPGITSQLRQSGGDGLSVSSRYSSSSSTPSESSSDESCGFLQDHILITSLGPTMVGEADWPSSVPGGSHSMSRPVEKVSSDDEQKKLEAHKKSLNKTVKRMRSMLNLVVESIASAEIEDVILAEQETNLDAASECNAYITYARCLLQQEEEEAERRLLDAELSDAELSDAASDTSRPGMIRSDTGRSDRSSPDMLRSDTGRTDSSRPDMLRSDTGRTDSSRPDMLRSDTGRTDSSRPDMLRSDTGRTDSSRPDMLRSDTGRTDSSRPDMLRSDTGRTDSSRPDMLRSDTGRTDSSRPDMLRSDTGRTDSSRPDMLRSDTGRTDSSRPDMLRSDTGRTDSSRPDMLRSDTGRTDSSRPDMLRSDTGRTDSSRPDMLRSDTGRSDRSSPEMLRLDTGRSDRSSPDMMRPDTDRLDAGTFSPTSGSNGVDSEGEQSNLSAETHSKVPPNVWLANKDALQDCESSQNQLEEATREFGSLSAAVHRRGVALTKKIQSYLWEDSEVPPDDPLAQAEEDSIEVAKNAHRETIGVVGWLSGALERIPHTPEHSWELTTTDVRDALHFLPTKVEKLVNSYVAHQDSFKEASRDDEEAAEVVLDPEGQEEAEEETVWEMEGNEWEEAEGDEEGIGEETPEGTDVRLALDKLPSQFEGTRPPASRAATIEPMASEEAVRARAEVRSSSYEKSKTLGEESDTFHPAQVVWLVLRGVYARLAGQVGESHVGGTSGRKKKSKGAISGKKSAPTNRCSGSSATPTAPKGGRKTRMSPREKSRRVGKASVTTSPRPTGTGRRVTQKRVRPSRAGKQACKIVAEEFTEEDDNDSAQEDETAEAQEGIERIQSREGDSEITRTDIEDDHSPEAAADRLGEEINELGDFVVKLQKASEVELREK
ncbi:hypothetical protein Pmar_PMAR003586 [Perkinsus marinus ATCC 50983]|uniref:Uncharacterized protein n=1 Tax=Perkinsus marinus (strain ATCC 50983 / TXsc) TaxID=423536 RepID=C5KHR1_PERM5|nr:hypothetical protein Pmar_PMAR003586 [Perkinsus marinus ATCC 50983]EER16123.1 hypothetical protein Pmar_PMAR003586 [Perkinsus marinus ATCC 50983]|eukprot:XP_002784327.1 hypothetical protein Pmar_PMAR003586 [Perkinsus marinus ATCC 50983]